MPMNDVLLQPYERRLLRENNVGTYAYRHEVSPTDVELVRVYLRQKLIVGSLPQGFQKLFLDVALYQHNPQDLVAMHEQLEEDQEDWYFFMPRSRKYLNGQQPERIAGNGYWKTVEKDTPVVENNGEVIGFKRVLDFYAGRHSGGVKTEWQMHEYLTKQQKDHITHEIPAPTLAPATILCS